MPYWRLFYHVVWATKRREPLIQAHHHETIQRSIRAMGQEHRALVHAVGIMPDHVHVVVSIPPSLAISTLIGRMKGSTSHLLNSLVTAETGVHFAWQSEYGVMSFGEKVLHDVIDYTNNQPARHASQNLWPALEETGQPIQPPSGGFVG